MKENSIWYLHEVLTDGFLCALTKVLVKQFVNTQFNSFSWFIALKRSITHCNLITFILCVFFLTYLLLKLN